MEGHREKAICRCDIPENLRKDMMYEKIAEYIRNLPPEQCVTDLLYEKRLSVCSGCKALAGGLTCMHCGCFVLARAKKTGMTCPMPGENRWSCLEQEDEL